MRILLFLLMSVGVVIGCGKGIGSAANLASVSPSPLPTPTPTPTPSPMPSAPPAVGWVQAADYASAESMYYAMAFDSSKNSYVAGVVFGAGPFNFSNGVTATGVTGGCAAILVKYDPDGNAQWARTLSSGNCSAFIAVSVSSSDEVYAAGYVSSTFSGTVSDYYPDLSFLGGGILAKYDSSGVLQWQTEVSPASNNLFQSVNVDASGNVFVSGYVENATTYDFGNSVTAVATEQGDAFIAEFDSAGNAQWVQLLSVSSSTSYVSIAEVALDSSANLYLLAAIDGSGTFDFGNGITLTGSAGFTVVLVKFDSTGAALWAKEAPANVVYQGIAVANSGNIYLAGDVQTSTSVNFGNGVLLTGSLSDNTVLVKCDSSGTVQWAVSQVSGSGQGQFYSVAVDSNENAYVAGAIGFGTFDFGNSATVSAYYGGSYAANGVLVKYDSSGTAQWAGGMTGNNGAAFYSAVRVDSAGNVYTIGQVAAGLFGFGNGFGLISNVTAGLGGSGVLVKY